MAAYTNQHVDILYRNLPERKSDMQHLHHYPLNLYFYIAVVTTVIGCPLILSSPKISLIFALIGAFFLCIDAFLENRYTCYIITIMADYIKCDSGLYSLQLGHETIELLPNVKIRELFANGGHVQVLICDRACELHSNVKYEKLLANHGNKKVILYEDGDDLPSNIENIKGLCNSEKIRDLAASIPSTSCVSSIPFPIVFFQPVPSVQNTPINPLPSSTVKFNTDSIIANDVISSCLGETLDSLKQPAEDLLANDGNDKLIVHEDGCELCSNIENEALFLNDENETFIAYDDNGDLLLWVSDDPYSESSSLFSSNIENGDLLANNGNVKLFANDDNGELPLEESEESYSEDENCDICASLKMM